MAPHAETFRLHCGLRFFEKADAPAGQQRRIGGIVTTDAVDRHGETLHQDGLDFSEFLHHGFFNESHGKNSVHVVGWPDKRSLRRFRPGEVLPDGSTANRNGHWVEGYLIPNDPMADAIWHKGRALAAAGADRGLGFSVEGKTLARDIQNPKRVLAAKVRHIAITPSPVNTDTTFFAKGETDVLAKSLFSEDVMEAALTTTSGAAVIPESLEGGRNYFDFNEVAAKVREAFPGIGPDLVEKAARWVVSSARHTKGDDSMNYTHGNRMMKGESADHYGMRMSMKKAHPAEQYNALFSGFFSKAEPAEGDEPDEDDVEKAIAEYTGQSLNKGAVSPEQFDTALNALQAAVQNTQPLDRRSELAKGAAAGELSAAEAAELAALAQGGDGGTWGGFIGDDFAKSLDDAVLPLAEGMEKALTRFADRLEKSDTNRHEFEAAMADVLVAQGELIKGLTETMGQVVSVLGGQAGMPVRQPGMGGATQNWPAGVPSPAQLQAGANAALAQPLNKGMGAPQPPHQVQAQVKDPMTLKVMETMFMKSMTGQYGAGNGLAFCREDLHKALVAYDTDGTISPAMAAEVQNYANQMRSQGAA